MSKEEKYDAAGRLFSIVAALILAGRKGLTKEELFRVVDAYRQQKANGVQTAALEQMFTRDKDDLRNAGFDLTSDRSDSGRYVLIEREVSFPADVHLTGHQLQLLNLASEVWNQGSISAEVARGATRLRGLGISSSTENVLNIAPRINTHEPAFLRLSEAVAGHIKVEFDYRKPNSNDVERRRVLPWALRNISSQWLLQCWDEDQEEVRNFLLKRIVSTVKLVKEDKELVTFTAPTAADLAAARDDLQRHIESNVAVIEVRPNSEAWFHFIEHQSPSNDWVRHTLNFMDEHLLAEDLREYGADVRVISPDRLAAAVQSGLRKVIDAHA